jgi:hypothetical protein
MTDQLERDLTATLDRHAGAPIDTTALAASATRRGRRRRVRTYAACGTGVAALVAIAVLGLATLRPAGNGGLTGDQPTPSPTTTATAPAASQWNAPSLPAAKGVPGAAEAPGQVAVDPGLIHFGVEYPPATEVVTWTVQNGSESVRTQSSTVIYEVGLARVESALDGLLASHVAGGDNAPEATRSATTVAGRPATLFTVVNEGKDGWYRVRWQPVDGLWAEVTGTGYGTRDGIFDVASKVRLTAAYRCATPFRLTKAPPGARLLSCSVGLTGADTPAADGKPTRFGVAMLVIGKGAGRLTIEASNSTEPREPMNTTAGGHPARTFSDESGHHAIDVPNLDGTTFRLTATSGYSAQALLTTAGGIAVSGDGRNPATWPGTIIG